MTPRTRYAKSGDIHIAFQLFGDGDANLLFVPGFVSHVENCWEEPSFALWLRRLGRFARVAIFDKRGTGLSDRVEDLPTLEQRMDDARAVMDAAGFARAAVLGVSEGGSLAAMFAASLPDRCTALILVGTCARFAHTVSGPEAAASFLGYVETGWGSGASLPVFAPSRVGDAAFRDWWGRSERYGASPSAARKLQTMNREIEIAPILPAVRVPTLVIHRTGDRCVSVEGGRELARSIPGARLAELPGDDHLPFVGDNAAHIADLVGEFVTGAMPLPDVERVLATILFTDIVRSTERASALGDRRWSDLLSAHDGTVRRELQRFRGREIKSLGDGFLAIFDGPARAIRCALAVGEALRPLGLAIRAGLHTGEIDLAQAHVRGIAVHIAARILGAADTGQVMVSRTVKDLVAGSAIGFEDRGPHVLAGIGEEWQLFRVLAHAP